MSVESTLCRVLDIRFIDARRLITEAKLNIGIDGYNDVSQDDELINEAKRIYYEELNEDTRIKMGVLKSKLNVAIKLKDITTRTKGEEGSVRTSTTQSCSSSNDDEDLMTNLFSRATGASSRRRCKFLLWPKRE